MEPFLLEIAERLKTQDNRCTTEPMFCVQEKKTIYGLDPRWSDDIVWIDSEADHQEVPAPADGLETKTLQKTGKIHRWETVMVAFTDIGSQEYIRLNGHNHSGELRIYADSFRRCPEMLAIRAYLLSLAEK